VTHLRKMILEELQRRNYAGTIIDCDLFPISSWPYHVVVFAIADENLETGLEIKSDQVRNLAWAMLFQTFAEAETHYKNFS
jgi:hypothetical protein